MDLPPCLKAILSNKAYLHRYYHHLLRYVKQYKPDAFPTLIEHLLKEGVKVELTMSDLQPFNCQELHEFCSETCPLSEDIFSWLKNNTSEVYISKNEDNDVILKVVLNDGNVLTLDIGSESVGRMFVTQIAYIYGKHIDFDLRRKNDRAKWNDLMNFWLQKAKRTDISQIDEEYDYIRNTALDYLYSVQVKPKDDWKGEPNVAVTLDGEYALFLKESLRSHVSRVAKQKISFKKLTMLLQPEVESVWVRIHGTRYAFYKFKMTEVQKQEYERYLRLKKEEEENKEEEKKEENNLSDFGDWDLEDVLGD